MDGVDHERDTRPGRGGESGRLALPERMGIVADKRRRRSGHSTRRVSGPGPSQGLQIVHTPGVADQMLRELAPLLAEEGIDLDNPDSLDPQVLQQALNRAVERRNLALFTPVGEARDMTVTTLRLVVEALDDDNTALATAILEQVKPEPPNDSTASVAGCIGLALGLLDRWLSGQHRDVPDGLAEHTRLPDADWYGQPVAVDILALARMGRAFGSLDTLHMRHHGHQLLYGSALALAAVTAAWAQQTATPVGELVRTIIE